MGSKHSFSATFVVCLMLFNHGCVVTHGDTIGSGHAVVSGHVAIVNVSPSLTVKVPVNVAIGDKVAEAAANAAVGYLKGLLGAITSLNRAEAVQKGIDAGVTKAAEVDQQVDRNELEKFVQQVVAEI